MLSACGVTQAQIRKADSLNQELMDVYKELKSEKAKYEEIVKQFSDGEITKEEFISASKAVADSIEKVSVQIPAIQEKIEQVKAEGATTWQVVIASALAFLSRGIPTKGPLGIASRFLGGYLTKIADGHGKRSG